MPSLPTPKPVNPSPGEYQDDPLPDLENLAKEWHQRLREPGIQQLIQDGKMKLNPLVEKLLEMYPEEKENE